MRRLGPSSSAAVKIVAFIAAVVALHFAQLVLLPVAIAVLLGFALAPIVRWLERRRLPRAAAVALTLAFTGLAIGGVLTLVVTQGRDFVQKSGTYRETIAERLKSTRLGAAAVQRALIDIKSAAQLPPPEATPPTNPTSTNPADAAIRPPLSPKAGIESPPPAAPVPAAAQPPSESPTSLWDIVARVGQMGAIAIITVLLLTAILVHREDLRDRLVRLLGVDDLPLTRQTLEDASQRISRYLLAQAAINTAFGLSVGTGLMLLGMPTPLLFGALSGLLRFVPIVGPMGAMSIAVLTAIAAFPDWHMPIAVLALFACSEAVCAYVLEPWLYGRNAGLSLFGVVVAMSFWGWLWGIAGLLVAVPLTVCVVLLGRHFPSLEPLGVLLSDAPALSPSDRLHHRLLSADIAGARAVVDEFEAAPEDPAKARPPAADALWLPSLRRAARDAAHGRLLPDELVRYLDTARAVLAQPFAGETPTVTSDERPVLLLATSNQIDALAGEVVRRSLSRATPVPVRLLDPALMLAEIVESSDVAAARAIAVVSVASAARRRGRVLARVLRDRLPGATVVLAALTHPDPAEGPARVWRGVRLVQSVAELQQALGLAPAAAPVVAPAERTAAKPDAYEASPTPRARPRPAH